MCTPSLNTATFRQTAQKCLYICIVLTSWPLQSNPVYDHRIDVQVRYDNRSNRDDRVQYRVRYYPQITFSDKWSLNSFIVTGDDFASSHNTFGESDSQEFAVRRLYFRRTLQQGKVEFGVIPTYKGRVSATGLSKDGWIQGLRYVTSVRPGHQLEFVAGSLNDTDPNRALSLKDSSDYFELEYSASLTKQHAVEFGIERITAGNYARAEWRYSSSDTQTWNFEYVRRLDDAQNKVVVGTETELAINGYNLDIYAYYAYVSEEFGFRAELTEDYLGTGHGGSLAISGDIGLADLDWFSRIDVVDSTKRLLVGLKRKF